VATAYARGVDDIDALINEAADQLVAVRGLYQRSLTVASRLSRLQAKIKNVLENQRSALDYLAHAIVERDGKAGSRAYFPVAKKPEVFSDVFGGQMPGVRATRPDIEGAIEKRQPYQPGYEWLEHLVFLTNENKHRRLTPQTQEVTAELRGGPGGGTIGAGDPDRKLIIADEVTILKSMNVTGVDLPEGAAIRLAPGAEMTVSGPGPLDVRNVTQTEIVDWLFADLAISALATLERIQAKLPGLLAEVIHVAGL
jgi:hypothetical protein